MDKFTPVHNDVLEALVKQRLSSYEWQVLLSVIRKTYGFVNKQGERKKTDFIASSQISIMTNVQRSHVSRAIGKLIQKGFLKKEGAQIGLSKDFYKLPKQVIMEKGKITHTGNSKLPKQVTKELPNQVQGCTDLGNSELPNQVHTKEIYKETTTKDNISKDISFEAKKTSRKNKQEKSEKEPPQRDPRVTICREYWYEQFEAILENPYPKNYGKDSSNWKWFLKIYNSVAWAKGFTDFYLKWDNPFVKQCGHSLDAFIKTLPSILEMKIQNQHWVKKHEKGLHSISETVKEMFLNKT